MQHYPFEEKNFLGNRMRELRLLFGYKQDDIAKTLNVSRSTYSYYETGTTRPDPSVLGKLAHYYNISVSLFYEDAPADLMSLRDPGPSNRRTTRSTVDDPHKISELLPVERSLILFLRTNGYVNADEVLNSLKYQVDRKRRAEAAELEEGEGQENG